ncbi:MAG: hypothetical protein ABUT39_05045 [Acidobacteriota bacterium]
MDEGTSTDELKYGAALLVIIVGLLLIAGLAWLLPVKDGWTAANVIALVGTLTTFLGTVVGAFLGVRVGAAGKQKSDEIAHRALAALSPSEAARVLQTD